MVGTSLSLGCGRFTGSDHLRVGQLLSILKCFVSIIYCCGPYLSVLSVMLLSILKCFVSIRF